MAEDILNKEIVDRLLKIPGRCRGLAIRDNLEYVLLKEGKVGLEKLNQVLAESQSPFRTSDIKPMEFYPVGMETICLLAMKKAFGYSDQIFEEVGAANARQSLVVRLFAKYFVSLERVAKEAPKMWRNYYEIGEISSIEINKPETKVLVRVEGFNIHPLHCRVLKGYFTAIVKMVVGASAEGKEISCPFNGGKAHEFLLTW